MASIAKEDYVALAEFRKSLRRFLHVSEENARWAGLTPQQHMVLLAIKGQQGEEWLTVTALADALQVKHHTAVGLLDRCQASGLICRTYDPSDRRIVRAVLTPKGESLLERVTQANKQELSKLRSLPIPT